MGSEVDLLLRRLCEMRQGTFEAGAVPTCPDSNQGLLLRIFACTAAVGRIASREVTACRMTDERGLEWKYRPVPGARLGPRLAGVYEQ